MRRSFGRALLVAFLVLAGCARPAVAPGPTPTPSPSPSPTPLPVYSVLNGVQIKPRTGDHRIAAVMIDNYPINARPQSGLRDADIVYEVEAEGGITRYMALYLEAQPKQIGPVRSARTYFVDLARPYNPLFAHAGENNDVWAMLADLRESGFADMDQIVGTPEAFWRDPSRDMPHNLYTSIAKMRATGPKYGYKDTPFVAEEFAFTPDPAPTASPPEVTVTFWNKYSVRFHPKANGYQRIIAGSVQHDLNDPTPYSVADIIAVWIPAKVLDELGDLEMNVYGSFPALLIRDGQAVPATWYAPNPNRLPLLLDKAGEALALAPGQIYVEVLPQGGTVKTGKNVWSY
ncbi:MAG: DUF3048 domain-containing protein [Candidatus Eremiobacteraeota bacterium]|nr:DUF3048 domain-containing protein [Candidatus Eremiobacteraeota bacterium]